MSCHRQHRMPTRIRSSSCTEEPQARMGIVPSSPMQNWMHFCLKMARMEESHKKMSKVHRMHWTSKNCPFKSNLTMGIESWAALKTNSPQSSMLSSYSNTMTVTIWMWRSRLRLICRSLQLMLSLLNHMNKINSRELSMLICKIYRDNSTTSSFSRPGQNKQRKRKELGSRELSIRILRRICKRNRGQWVQAMLTSAKEARRHKWVDSICIRGLTRRIRRRCLMH